MAEKVHEAATKCALKKLEDQLTCAICLGNFKEPKMLQCFHVYCKPCLKPPVLQDHQEGQLAIICPTCRQTTILPPTKDVSSLPSAFHIHHLFEIKEALEKLKEPQKMQCEKCTISRTATNFCRDCGQFICDKCLEMHSEWKELTKHTVISIEDIHSDVEQLVPLKKLVLCCSQHQGKELDIYCETCEELICIQCAVKIHKDHQYILVGDSQIEEMTACVEQVEKDLSITTKAKEQLVVRCQELDDQRAAVQAEIKLLFRQLQEANEKRMVELCKEVDQHVERKKKNLAAQKDKMETIETQQMSCLSFMKESLRTGSQGEVMKVKIAVMKKVKEMRDNFKPDTLSPCEPADVKFTATFDIQEYESASKQFGKVYVQDVFPDKCYATGKGLKVAKSGEGATAVLHIVNSEGEPFEGPVKSVIGELHSGTRKRTCGVYKKELDACQYDISYLPLSRGRHQLHIKVEEKHIKRSPFSVTVIKNLSTPTKTIEGVKGPMGVAVNRWGSIIVAESEGNCISIFNPSGEKTNSFGSLGSENGQFNYPVGVAIDASDNILVADYGNHRIQKFSSDRNFITAVGNQQLEYKTPIATGTQLGTRKSKKKYDAGGLQPGFITSFGCYGSGKVQFPYNKGKKQVKFKSPTSVGIHPRTRMVYVIDSSDHSIQILNQNLSSFCSFGSRGSDNGQFNSPWGVAFDSTGNVYVADSENHRIQVFTTEGKFLRKFGKKGEGNGELNLPCGISIDSDDVLYVTECDNPASSFSFHM